MFYIVQGEFYEAYHLYKDDIQRVRQTMATLNPIIAIL